MITIILYLKLTIVSSFIRHFLTRFSIYKFGKQFFMFNRYQFLCHFVNFIYYRLQKQSWFGQKVTIFWYVIPIPMWLTYSDVSMWRKDKDWWQLFSYFNTSLFYIMSFQNINSQMWNSTERCLLVNTDNFMESVHNLTDYPIIWQTTINSGVYYFT